MKKNASKIQLNSRQIAGIVSLSISFVLLVFSIFNIIPTINRFLLGTFGAVLYAVLLFAMLISVALITNRKFVYSVKYALYIAGAFLCILAIIHLACTAGWGELSYGEYLSKNYYFKYTPGGVIVGIISYPFLGLLNVVAGLVFYGIALAIFVALIIEYLYAVKQFNKLNAPIVVVPKEQPEEVATEDNVETINTQTSSFDFSALKNEPTDTSNYTNNGIQDTDTDRISMKKKLGLIKEDPEDIIIPSKKEKKNLTPAEQLYGSREEVRQEWLHKNITSMHSEPKPVVNESDEKNKRLREFLNATGYAKPTVQNVQNIDNITPVSEPSIVDNVDQTPVESVNSYPNEPVVDNQPIINQKLAEQDAVTTTNVSPKIDTSSFKKDNNVEHLDPGSKVASSLNRSYNIGGAKPKNNFEQMHMIGAEKGKKPLPPIMTKALNYNKPPVELLNKVEIDYTSFENEQNEKSRVIESTLENFHIPVQVQAVRRGAAVTRYELKMPVGIPVKRVLNFAEDIELALASRGSVRIETPIRGKSAVGIEVPNDKIDMVSLREIIESKDFTANTSPLAFALGKDVDGKVFTCNLAKMPHLLVAGSTGSGKSVCLNSLLISLIYRTSPEDLKLILVDPKRVEFTAYNDLPHLIMPKVITDSQKAMNAFDWLINEMERRYEVFMENCVNNITNYNNLPGVQDRSLVKMSYIVMVVDELADLMATGNKKELENKIVRLVQKARAAGIHLVLATQRPSVDVLTGTIKANLPSRIAFAVTNFMDSKTILDQAGAEKLLGRGDMLYSPSDSEPVRVQGAYISNEEVISVVEYVKEHNSTNYDESIANSINKEGTDGVSAGNAGGGGQEYDPMLKECLKVVIEEGQASISLLQRKCLLGFPRAARIIDQMQEAKFISPAEGGKTRNVYITMEEYNELFGDK